MLEILNKIKDAEDSSGVGYYETFMVDDIVVKRYDLDHYEEEFNNDIQKHIDLDQENLVPKMISNFIHNRDGYLIIEKISCLNDHFRKGKASNSYGTIAQEKYQPDNFWDLVEELRNDLAFFDYMLDDEIIDNFGWKGKTFMCLDEGCLKKIEFDKDDFGDISWSDDRLL
jgi:hypothetical protein